MKTNTKEYENAGELLGGIFTCRNQHLSLWLLVWEADMVD